MIKFTAGQRAAIEQLAAFAARRPELIAVVGSPRLVGGLAVVTVRLPTGELPCSRGGLPLRAVEDFDILIPPAFPITTAITQVKHDRFAGYLHVVAGHGLCIHLDPDREWTPRLGILGYLEQLWQWLGKAAAAEFDAYRVLFHAVGGVDHTSSGTPMLVVRDAIPVEFEGRLLLRAGLVKRTAHRIDLTTWCGGWRDLPADFAPVVLVPGPLVFGAGYSLCELVFNVTHRGFLGRATRTFALDADAVTTDLFHAFARQSENNPAYVVVGARAATSESGGDYHLLAAQIRAADVARLGELARRRIRRLGPLARFTVADLDPDVPLEWCPVSDDRAGVATRRDVSRPVSWFAGKHVELWGCGGLGSWIAEILVRAGVRKIVLRDKPNGRVRSGLLVRQNFSEADVGNSKATALARRLRAIRDDVDVQVPDQSVIALLAASRLPDCDLIIDATINVAVAAGLEATATRSDKPRPALASLVTDTPTATLGMLAVALPGWPGGPHDIERRNSPAILQDGQLEHFHIFWRTVAHDQELVAERGCSAPTFHGAANDLMAVAATAVDLLARRMQAAASGLDLFAVGHAALDRDATRRHSITPMAPDVIDLPDSGGSSLRVAPEAIETIDDEFACTPVRYIALGECDDSCNAIWVDQIVALPDTADGDAAAWIAQVTEVTNGISSYLGDVVRVDGLDLSERDEPVAQALERTAATSGVAVLAVAAGSEGPRFRLFHTA